MNEARIFIPDALIGAKGGCRVVQIPVGYISLEDLLSHVEYQLGAGTTLTDELDSQLAEEHAAGKREMAEILQRVVDQRSASVAVDMEAAHRILTAETLGWAPTDGQVGV